MNIDDYRFLLAERGTLNRLIDQTSPGNEIGRLSLKQRLQKVEDALEAYSNVSFRPMHAILTFRGDPVVDNRGIRGHFGTKAFQSFATAVSQIGASLRGPLAPKGPVPNGADYELLITGTATGSFGFQIEGLSQELALDGDKTSLEFAIDKVKEILKASVEEDDQLADAIADTDPRALRKVHSFIKTLVDNGATCALEIQGEEFHFASLSQVRTSEQRLSQRNILEADIEMVGRFRGYLPDSRQAEFFVTWIGTELHWVPSPIRKTIIGIVSRPLDRSIDIGEIRNRNARIEAHIRRVGSGTPRYDITNCVVLD